MSETIIKDSVKAVLERIIAKETPASRNLEDNRGFGEMTFIEYFCQNTPDREISNPDNGVEHLLSMDYFRRFKGSVKIADAFSGMGEEAILDVFAEHLREKDSGKYNREKEEEFAIPDIESEIVSTIYENLLRNGAAVQLINRSIDVDDLKAVYFVDRIVPYLRSPRVVEIIENMMPEPAFIELAKVKANEGDIRSVDEDSKIAWRYSKKVEKLTKKKPTEERVGQIRSIQDENKEFQKKYSRFREDLEYMEIVGEVLSHSDKIENTVMDYLIGHTFTVTEGIKSREYSDNLDLERKLIEKDIEEEKGVLVFVDWYGLDNYDSELADSLQERKKYLAWCSGKREELKEKKNGDSMRYRQTRRLLRRNLNESNSKWLLNLRGELSKKVHHKQLDDRYVGELAHSVKELREKGLENLRQKYRQTVDIITEEASRIDVEYELSGNYRKDVRLGHRLRKDLLQLQERLSWLDETNEELENKIVMLDERQSYFEDISRVKQEIIGQRKELGLLPGKIKSLKQRNYCHLDEIKHKLNQYREKESEFGKYFGDIYLGKYVHGFSNELNTVVSLFWEQARPIMEKFDGIINGINPEFESNGSIAKDIETISGWNQQLASASGFYSRIEEEDRVGLCNRKRDSLKNREEEIMKILVPRIEEDRSYTSRLRKETIRIISGDLTEEKANKLGQQYKEAGTYYEMNDLNLELNLIGDYGSVLAKVNGTLEDTRYVQDTINAHIESSKGNFASRIVFQEDNLRRLRGYQQNDVWDFFRKISPIRLAKIKMCESSLNYAREQLKLYESIKL